MYIWELGRYILWDCQLCLGKWSPIVQTCLLRIIPVCDCKLGNSKEVHWTSYSLAICHSSPATHTSLSLFIHSKAVPSNVLWLSQIHTHTLLPKLYPVTTSRDNLMKPFIFQVHYQASRLCLLLFCFGLYPFQVCSHWTQWKNWLLPLIWYLMEELK